MNLKENRKRTLIVLDCLDHGGATRIAQEITNKDTKKKFVILAGECNETKFVINDFKNSQIVTFPTYFENQFLYYLYTIFGSFSKSLSISKNYNIDNIILNLPYSALGILMNPIFKKTGKTYIFHGGWDLEKYSSSRGVQYNLNKPVFLQVRSFMKMIKFFLHFHIQKLCMSKSMSVTVYSNYSKGIVTKYYGINALTVIKNTPPLTTVKKIKKINLVDKRLIRKKLNIDNDEFIFMIASRIEQRKGIDIALKAIAILKGITNKKFRLVITGPAGFDEWYVYEMLMYSRKHNLFTHVIFLNELDRVGELYKLYQAVDCVLMPSTSLETLGLVTLESLHFGTPVIGFKSGATEEILSITNKHLLINKISSTSLANKMRWLMENNHKQ